MRRGLGTSTRAGISITGGFPCEGERESWGLETAMTLIERILWVLRGFQLRKCPMCRGAGVVKYVVSGREASPIRCVVCAGKGRLK